MKNKLFFFLLLSFAFLNFATAQEKGEEETIAIQVDTVTAKKKRKLRPYNPLSPAKAAFYSAVLPGLGQAYNKKYWKIPIVYAAIGGSVYFYLQNDREYNRYRDAYKRRIAGFSDDEFQGLITDDDLLIDAQEFFQRNRDLWSLVTIGLYALNIIDANVDAHLQQYNVNENLTFRPKINQNNMDFSTTFGLSITYQF